MQLVIYVEEGCSGCTRARQIAGRDQVSFLGNKEPGVAFELDGDARAYPLQILIWHEIVNDVVAGKPVLITFCPLCNTAIALDRVVAGRALEFGVSGFLGNTALLMFDCQTDSGRNGPEPGRRHLHTLALPHLSGGAAGQSIE